MATIVMARNRNRDDGPGQGDSPYDAGSQHGGHAGGGSDDPSRTRAVRASSAASVQAEPGATGMRKIRIQVWNALGDPSSSRVAYGFFCLILTLILVSCVAFVVETIPSYCCGRYETLFSTIETVCVVAFTFEYMARFVVVPTSMHNDGWFTCTETEGTKAEVLARIRFFVQVFNLVDFLAIFPFYLTLIVSASGSSAGTPMQSTQFLRVIRLARVFRLFKLSKYSDGMWLLTATLIRSWRALGMLSFFMLISVILFSSVMYFVEKGRFFYCTQSAANASLCLQAHVWEPKVPTEALQAGLHECQELATEAYLGPDFPLRCCDGEGFYVWPPMDADANGCLDRSNYDSIFSTAWWCVVTMTTVGYGDSYPHSTEGKILACVTMLSGILILALPITVIGSNFNIEYEKSEAEARMRRQLELARGLKWEEVATRPKGTEIKNELLAAALEEKTAFSQIELQQFGIAGLAADSYVVSGPAGNNKYYQLANLGQANLADDAITAASDPSPGAHSNAGSHKALLGAVEKLLQEQRQVILKRAEDMITQHVREIAKEVVTQAHARQRHGGEGARGRKTAPVRPVSGGDPADPANPAGLSGDLPSHS
eukprot:Tamp_08146.p1 GENE.Tamp_08146~~Tamp_08146.p1  ORF type:complete len:600 (+),score=92.68 Tamp_08146:391-2190(+)